MNIPAITADQMREVDRLMIEYYGIELMQMMENAGYRLASFARQRFFSGDPVGKRVIALIGSGGNGGGGLAAVRHLHNWGVDTQVYLTKKPADFSGVPGHQLRIINMLGVPVKFAEEISSIPKTDLVLDAIIGYSLKGPPKGVAGLLIQLANQHNTPILSLDVPSGLDSTSGKAFTPHIRAAATLTLALPKIGLLKESVKNAVGELYLADISVPFELYDKIGLEVGPIFSKQAIIQLR